MILHEMRRTDDRESSKRCDLIFVRYLSATATVQVAKPQVIGENNEPIDSESGDLQNFWHTSVGKFKFCVDDLPQPLQYIFQLLQARRQTLHFFKLYLRLNRFFFSGTI